MPLLTLTHCRFVDVPLVLELAFPAESFALPLFLVDAGLLQPCPWRSSLVPLLLDLISLSKKGRSFRHGQHHHVEVDAISGCFSADDF